MIKLEDIVRSNILELQPYSSARDEFSGKKGVFLDANENPFGEFNRYPDPHQKKLKQKLAELKNVTANNIFVGNGSDEVIDLALRIFCAPGTEKALTFSPTYGMYDVSAAINNVELLKVPLNNEFQLDLEKIKPFLSDESIKLIFICSPNNPTGNLMNRKDIEYILNAFNGVVLIDEAYIDFAEGDSLIELIEKYNNLIVSQTFSKAWGLAAVRVGTAYANENIIAFYNKVKPPYNISKLNQEAALAALADNKTYTNQLIVISNEKERLKMEFLKIDLIKKIYPSHANFLLLEVEDANHVYDTLVSKNIITRNRSKQIPNCIRISIGTPNENKILLNAIKNI